MRLRVYLSPLSETFEPLKRATKLQFPKLAFLISNYCCWLQKNKFSTVDKDGWQSSDSSWLLIRKRCNLIIFLNYSQRPFSVLFFCDENNQSTPFWTSTSSGNGSFSRLIQLNSWPTICLLQEMFNPLFFRTFQSPLNHIFKVKIDAGAVGQHNYEGSIFHDDVRIQSHCVVLKTDGQQRLGKKVFDPWKIQAKIRN